MGSAGGEVPERLRRSFLSPFLTFQFKELNDAAISTYVAHSAIEGLGVFAAEPVARGRLMWSLNPKFDMFVLPGELDSLPPHMLDLHRPLLLSASGDAGRGGGRQR